MTYLDVTKEQFQQFMALPTEGPVMMLNLLKFKSKLESSGKSGAQKYKDYLNAAQPFFGKVDAKILFYGTPQMNLIGPSELEWDKVLIVEYGSKNDFINMVTAEGYPAQMRSAALEDARLIFCT